MNTRVRNAIRQKLKDEGMTQGELAVRTELPYQYVSDMLMGRRGSTPPNWIKVLEELGLELCVCKKHL